MKDMRCACDFDIPVLHAERAEVFGEEAGTLNGNNLVGRAVGNEDRRGLFFRY